MEITENITTRRSSKMNDNTITKNYQQQTDGADQRILTDPSITAETDELDPTFHQQDPPADPQKDDNEGDDDDEFPAIVDGEEDDFDLNHDQDNKLSLNIDEDDLN